MSQHSQKKLESDWKTMIHISHDFFHLWRRAVKEAYGEEAAERLTVRFWELVGESTASSYLSKGKINPKDLSQIVGAVARSSEIMGEKVRVERDGEDYLLIHEACPWMDSYKMAGYPDRCQPGCDKWFESALASLSSDFSVITEQSMAQGKQECIRRFKKKF